MDKADILGRLYKATKALIDSNGYGDNVDTERFTEWVVGADEMKALVDVVKEMQGPWRQPMFDLYISQWLLAADIYGPLEASMKFGWDLNRALQSGDDLIAEMSAEKEQEARGG